MVTTTEQWMVTAVIIATIMFIFVPLIYHWYDRFCNMCKGSADGIDYQTQSIINGRYPKLIKISNILAMIFFLTQQPAQVLVRISPLIHTNPDLFQTVLWYDFHLFHLFIWLTFGLSQIRVWLMYYDINYYHVLKNQEWMKHINPSRYTSQNNFWLKYRSTLGSMSYMIKFIVIITIIMSTVNYLIWTFVNIWEHREYMDMYGLSVVVLPATISLMIYYSAPSMIDTLLLRYEIKMGIFIASVLVPIHSGFSVVWIVIGFDEALGQLIIRNYIHSIGFVALLLLTTYWMPKQIQSQSQNMTKASITFLHSNERLIHIFGNKLKFELFGQELLKHGKHGLLLCFIEMLQLKTMIKYNLYRHSKNIPMDVNKYWSDIECQGLIQKEYIPKSSLVYNSQFGSHIINIGLSKQWILKVMYCLYQKYLKTENSFLLQIKASDINIDHFSAFKNQLSFMNTTQLFQYFDPILDEIYNLLKKQIETIQDININSECIPLKKSIKNLDGETLSNTKLNTHAIPSLYGVLSKENMELLYKLYQQSKVKFYKTSFDLGLFDHQIEILMAHFATFETD